MPGAFSGVFKAMARILDAIEKPSMTLAGFQPSLKGNRSCSTPQRSAIFTSGDRTVVSLTKENLDPVERCRLGPRNSEKLRVEGALPVRVELIVWGIGEIRVPGFLGLYASP